ncbi:deaminase domain-containing protein [Leptolyngbya boryana CZ1]|nr:MULTISPECIES: deaminase domain-containing protein [Leptolyngbya]MBN8563019.1 hypothetical protein [Leptolyngbya sp. UWPOB_LEPTO1]WNZ48597.1 deaminase domain-containing protein [Leptolyngbya boryana CZ1]
MDEISKLFGEEIPEIIKAELLAKAKTVREDYIGRDFPSGNVAVAKVVLSNGAILFQEGTSRARSPSPLPTPKSAGGIFEPSIDSHSQRLMETDAEYKILSALALTLLEELKQVQVEGKLYLYTERKPCESCQNILRQFRELFPSVGISVVWDHPYP